MGVVDGDEERRLQRGALEELLEVAQQPETLLGLGMKSRKGAGIEQRLSLTPNVQVMGPVGDAAGFVAGCRVMALPIRRRGGVPFKLVEAMAAQRPVVATSALVSGLELPSGQALFIADSPREFAAAVVRLCNDPAFHSNVSRRGLEHVKQNWDVRIVERQVLDICASLPSLCPKRATMGDRLAGLAWIPYDRTFRTLARLASILHWYLSRARRQG